MMPGKPMEIISSAIIWCIENSQGIRICERHILLDQPGPMTRGHIPWVRERLWVLSAWTLVNSSTLFRTVIK